MLTIKLLKRLDLMTVCVYAKTELVLSHIYGICVYAKTELVVVGRCRAFFSLLSSSFLHPFFPSSHTVVVFTPLAFFASIRQLSAAVP